jgi:PIN domain nuclease of toxin-antitoxin system
MLAAQSQVEAISLVSADLIFKQLGVAVVW